MKRVQFKTLSIKNYLSVGNEPVVIDFKPGVNLITGINHDNIDRRNAVGKSTIPDAFFFCLFGETLRGIKKDYASNNVTGGTSQLDLEFDIITNKTSSSFIITRSINPSKCTIIKNGKDVTKDSIHNTNAYICDVIAATPTIFRNCVVLCANTSTPFMSMKQVEKRKFIENIFDLQVFSEMLAVVRNEYQAEKREYDLLNTKQQEVERTVEYFKEQKQQQAVVKKEKKKKYIERYKSNKQAIKNIDIQLATIDKLSTDKHDANIKKLKEQLFKYNKALDVLTLNRVKINTTKEVEQKKLTNLIDGKSNVVCDKCLRALNNDDVEHLEKHKAEIQQTINDATVEISKINEKYKKIQKSKEVLSTNIEDLVDEIVQIQRKKQSKQNLLSQLKQLNEWQESLESDIKHINNDTEELTAKTSAERKRLKEIVIKSKKQKEHLCVLDAAKFVLSEEGVKSHIAKKLLDIFNSVLQKYLQKLESNALCVFDEYFDEKIYNVHQKICSYHNFSGAERKAIDLACIFTFQDMRRIQSNITYNVIFFDELLDSSVDERGLDLIVDTLNEHCIQHNISNYIISHRKETGKIVTGEIIELEMRNRITRRIA